MVEAARRRALELGLAGVRFGVEDAANLSLDDDAVDGILCRFGLMLVPDMERMAVEIARVLRPGGRAVLAVWASSQLNPWITAVGSGRARARATRSHPIRRRPGPFRLADPERLRAVVLAGGLAIDRVEEVPVTWLAASLDEWWETTCDTSRALADLLERLSGPEAAALRLEAEGSPPGVPGRRRLAQRPRPRPRPRCHARLVAERRGQRIDLPSALATSSTAVSAVVFSRSRIGLASTISNEPTMPDSAMSSQARCASR